MGFLTYLFELKKISLDTRRILNLEVTLNTVQSVYNNISL